MREMKDSGVEWIGKIPKEWDLIKLKYVSKIKYGTAHEKDWLGADDKANIILVNSKFIM